MRGEGERGCLSLFYLPWETCWENRPSLPATAAVIKTDEMPQP
jgi:hypothetical protein